MASRAVKPTDLVEAAKLGDCGKAVEILKVYPTQVNVELSGKTALQEAACRGHIDMIVTLLRYKADLYSYDINYRTALHHAVKGNRPEAVLLLLKSDTKKELIVEKDGNGMTAPQLAFSLKFKNCVKTFMQWDSNVQFKAFETYQPTSVDSLHFVQKIPKGTKRPADALVEVETAGTKTKESETEGDQENKTQNDAPKCYSCGEREAAIKFEPCGCVISCLECSLSAVACDCGAPIEKKCVDENPQVKKYIENVQENRAEIQTLNDFITCHICAFMPLMCVLDCGHMYCIPCVKEIKKEKKSPTVECPLCKNWSMYKVLRTKWPIPSKEEQERHFSKFKTNSS